MTLTEVLLSSSYNYLLLIFSTAIWLTGIAVVLQGFKRIRKEAGGARIIWLIWSALMMSSSIWASAAGAVSGQIISAQNGFHMTELFTVLLITTLGMSASLALSLNKHRRLSFVLSGFLFGSTAAATYVLVSLSFKIAGATPFDLMSKTWPFVACAGLGAMTVGPAFHNAVRGRRHIAGAFLTVPVVTAFLMTPTEIPPSVPHWFPPGFDLLTVPQTLTVAVLIVAACAAFISSGDLLESFREGDSHRAYRHLALQDALTHLPNRLYVETVAKELLKEPKENGTICSVVLVSLDKFRAINDLYGYATGDAVLRKMASVFRAQLNDPVVIARSYGDEFLIIDPSGETPNDAVALARRVRELVRQPIAIDNECRPVLQCSIGLAVYPRDGHDLNSLVQRASLAVKQAKIAGWNTIQPYVPGMEEANRWETTLVSDLREAVLNNQLTLLFQKQYQTNDGRLAGHEAQLCWRHIDKGPIQPEDFLPIAEQSGIILDIGTWLLRQACLEAANWADPVAVSVNVAPSQMSRSDFTGLVSTVLMETGLDAQRLEIGLTGSTPIEDHGKVLHTITALRGMGVKVALNNFGAGYSSLDILQTLPFDKLNIAPALTQSLETSSHARAIMKSTVLLGRGFGIPVNVKGVETEMELELIKEMECQIVQGALFGKKLLPAQIKNGRHNNIKHAV